MARAPRTTAKKQPRLRALPGRAPSPAPARPLARSSDARPRSPTRAACWRPRPAPFWASRSGWGTRSCARSKLVRDCPGQVVVTGMGKAGHIGQKLSSTLASTGIRSVFLHPAEAVHGDLGRVGAGDVILALSNSGSHRGVGPAAALLQALGAPVVAITGDADSPLAKGAEVVLDIGRIEEACPWGWCPPRPPPRCTPWATRWR